MTETFLSLGSVEEHTKQKQEFHPKFLRKTLKNPAKMGAKQGHNLTSVGRCSKIEGEFFLCVFECNSSISGNVAGLAEQIKVGGVLMQKCSEHWSYKQAQMESAELRWKNQWNSVE